MLAFRWVFGLVLTCLGVAGCAERGAQVPSGTDGASAVEELVLEGMDADQQAFLWDVEHHGNVLSRMGFAALTAALRDGDSKALAALLAPEFAGGLLREPTEVERLDQVLRVVRQSESGQPAQVVDAAEFVAKLLEYRAPVAHSVEGCKIALMTLRPGDSQNLDAPWHGTGQLRLWGRDGHGQPGEVILYLAY